jgi:hypothetical protein
MQNQNGNLDNLQMHHPVVFYANKEGLGPCKHNLLLYYSVYYAHDDMFRPLWAIFRSQNCITKKSCTGYKYKLQV